MKSLSVIIPCRNEERYISKCLDSLLGSTYPKEAMEVLVVDGLSDDDTRTIVTEYAFHHPFIRLINNPERATPQALNLGITEGSGEFIVILSAHGDYPNDYFEKLVSESIRLDEACTGGVLNTRTVSNTPTAAAIINVLEDRFGTGSRFRSGASKISEVDTVAFGCYRRDVFEKFGLFDERLIRNQDIEFNKRILHGGGKIYLIPDVTCTYYARDTYAGLAKNNYQNGYWNILTPYYTHTLRSLSLRHFVPLLFVLGLIIPSLLALLYPPFLYISGILLCIYLSIIAVRSWQIKNNTTWLHQIAAFVTLHFSYGFGGIGGIIALTKKILFRGSL